MAEKLYYSIREVSELVGVDIPTLRYWEEEFPRLTPKRNTGKRRFYTKEHVELASQIRYLRYEKKLTIEGVRQYLARHKESDVERHQKIVDSLKAVRVQLLEIRQAL